MRALVCRRTAGEIVQRNLDRGLGAMVSIHATVHCGERAGDIIGIATTSCGTRCWMAAAILSIVSPVITGASPASPQPIEPVVALDPHQHIIGAPDFLARHHDGLDHRQADRDRLYGFDLHAGTLVVRAPAVA